MAKKNKSEEQKKVEEFLKTVQYNRKNTPGFDSLVKLIEKYGYDSTNIIKENI